MSNKRSNTDTQNKQRKKYKVASGFLDPGTSGIYATCTRRKERLAAQELRLWFEEKINEYYGSEIKRLEAESQDERLKEESEEDSNKDVNEESSIEEQIKRELDELKGGSNKPKTKNEKKREYLRYIDLNCECVIFFKTRKPIVPTEFVHRLMEELVDPKNTVKRTRYINRLTPITYSCNATMEQLTKLAEQVLSPHFHLEKYESEGQGIKFSIELNRRNFTAVSRDDIQSKLIQFVCQNGRYKHKIDYKNYDKLIMVECYKNNIGMSVVAGDYRNKFRKYNVQQIFESKFKDEENQQKTKEVTDEKSSDVAKDPSN